MHIMKNGFDRRYGVNIFGRSNSPIEKRKYRPGQHGKTPRKKVSNYCLQLVEKQKIKTYYNLSEQQLKNLFKLSCKNTKLDPGVAIISNLERRLDQIVYRLGLAPSIFSARQLVSHGHFTLNGKYMNIPSYLVNPGEIIAVREASRNIAIIQQSHEANSSNLPSYLKLEGLLSGSLLKAPEDLKEIPLPFEANPGAIVEEYSKLV